MKGIILAGGSGTRLHPSTISVSKQLLPVFDKPMIYYPICTLISSGITEILIISTSENLVYFERLFKDGSQWGLNISYAIQKSPNGIAESFLIGEKFIGNSSVALILGDNIFYGIDNDISLDNNNFKTGARVFAYNVPDPERYGVIEFEKEKIISIEEKPTNPKSSYVVTGLYFYDNKVIEISKSIKPSNRNELEITDVNRVYLDSNSLIASKLKRGAVWLDAGTPTSLLQASQFVQTIQERQQINIGCLEEICWKKNLISDEKFEKIISKAPNNSYGKYLKKIFQEKDI